VKTQYHRAITTQALSPCFSEDALETVIAANLGQDIWRYQFGYSHFHYDNNSFAAGDAYIEDLRRTVMDALQRGEAVLARQSFGRLTHTAQDFYAHSNYITLWRESRFGAAPDEIDPLLDELLTDSRLRSGRIYYPLEVFSFIPRLRPLVLPLLPRDSHAWMNIDDPSCPNFDYAVAVAIKRTELEFDRLRQALSPEQIRLFTEIQNRKSKGL
jgi:hypothetical protein